MRKKPAISHQPPSFKRWENCEAVFRIRRFEREPEQPADELDGVPVDRGEHVEPDDLDRDEAAHERQNPVVPR